MRGTTSTLWWLAGCVAVAVATRLLAFDGGPLETLDRELGHALRVSDGSALGRIAGDVLAPFDPVPFALVVATVLAAGLAGRRRTEATVAAASMLAAALTTQLLKRLLESPRQAPVNDFLPADAWPSGHMTAAASLAVALVLVTPPSRRRPVARAAVALSACVSLSLVLLGWHFPSDVVGGACVAGAWGAIAWRVTRLRAAAI